MKKDDMWLQRQWDNYRRHSLIAEFKSANSVLRRAKQPIATLHGREILKISDPLSNARRAFSPARRHADMRLLANDDTGLVAQTGLSSHF
jgi:hypothetical protein